jgi:hypothetical protein
MILAPAMRIPPAAIKRGASPMLKQGLADHPLKPLGLRDLMFAL